MRVALYTFHKFKFLGQFSLILLFFNIFWNNSLLLFKNFLRIFAVVLTKSISNFTPCVNFMTIWKFRKPFFRQWSFLPIWIMISGCKNTFLLSWSLLNNLFFQKLWLNIIEFRNHNTIINLSLQYLRWLRLEAFNLSLSDRWILRFIPRRCLIKLYGAASLALLGLWLLDIRGHGAASSAASLGFQTRAVLV